MTEEIYNRKYFQCDVENLVPQIAQFGKYRTFRYNNEATPTSAVVLEVCKQSEFDLALVQAGLENKTMIELTKQEAFDLSKSWD